MKEKLTTTSDWSVESSLGWKVEILSVNALQYEQDGKTIELAIEDQPDAWGNLEWIIYPPPDWRWKNDQPVGQKQTAEILNRIGLAFWKLDLKIIEIV